MKKQSMSLWSRIKVQLISGLLLAAVTTTVTFAWSTNTRLTKLETALISLASDVHDIKALLQAKGQ